MKIIFNIVFLLLSFNALSQSLIIGKLTGQKDNPIVFANIIIDNTQLGTISNKDGIFEIRIPEKCNSSALIISSIGYKTKKLNVKYLQKVRNCRKIAKCKEMEKSKMVKKSITILLLIIFI